MEQAAGVSRLQRFGVRLNEDQLGVVLVSRVSSNDIAWHYSQLSVSFRGKLLNEANFVIDTSSC